MTELHEAEPVRQQMEKSAGKKYDAGKPRLELLPPSYWCRVAELNFEFFENQRPSKSPSLQIANWYFYKQEFPKNFGYDAVPILEFGAVKYKAHNWFKGMRWGRLVGAFHRHCNKLKNGLWVPRDLNELDEESGLPHGQHAECCRVFLQEYYSAWYHQDKEIGENDCAWNEGEIK